MCTANQIFKYILLKWQHQASFCHILFLSGPWNHGIHFYAPSVMSDHLQSCFPRAPWALFEPGFRPGSKFRLLNQSWTGHQRWAFTPHPEVLRLSHLCGTYSLSIWIYNSIFLFRFIYLRQSYWQYNMLNWKIFEGIVQILRRMASNIEWRFPEM